MCLSVVRCLGVVRRFGVGRTLVALERDPLLATRDSVWLVFGARQLVSDGEARAVSSRLVVGRLEDVGCGPIIGLGSCLGPGASEQRFEQRLETLAAVGTADDAALFGLRRLEFRRDDFERADGVVGTEVTVPECAHTVAITENVKIIRQTNSHANVFLSPLERRTADRVRDRSPDIILARAYTRQRMFDEIMEKFEGSPSQQAVIRLLLERGFSVNDDGRVVSGGIEIPNTGIAREIGVDRRVVDSTTDVILDDPELRRIFQNISQVPSLMDLAPVLDLTVLSVAVDDAERGGDRRPGHGNARGQRHLDPPDHQRDPEFTDEPRLYLITDETLPGEVITRSATSSSSGRSNCSSPRGSDRLLSVGVGAPAGRSP